MANFKLGLEGVLLTKTTSENINKSLNKVCNEINTNSKLQLVAKLNSNNTKKVFQKQLDQISKKLKINIDNIELKRLATDVANLKKEIGSKGKSPDIDTTKISDKINSLNHEVLMLYENMKASKFTLPSGYEEKLKSIKNTIAQIDNQADGSKNASDEDRFAALEKVKQDLDEVTNQFNLFQKTSQTALNATNLASEKTKLSNRIKTWLQTNTNAGENLRLKMIELESQIESADGSKFTSLKKEFQSLISYANVTNQSGKSMLDNLMGNFSKFASWYNIGNVVSQATSKIRDAVTELKEVDTILTEISKTSDMTERQLAELGESAFDTANNYGKLATDYLTGVQEMTRAGYRGDLSDDMAQLSLLTQAAGDVTTEVANDYLIATDAAYKYEGNVKKLNAVLDGQNMIKIIVPLYRNIQV